MGGDAMVQLNVSTESGVVYSPEERADVVVVVGE